MRLYLPVVSSGNVRTLPSLRINQAEGVNTEAFHGAVTAREPRSDIAHITLCRVSGCRETYPRKYRGRFALVELPSVVLVYRMNKIREFMRILDKEDWRVLPTRSKIPSSV